MTYDRAQIERDVAEAKAAADAATPGPWERRDTPDYAELFAPDETKVALVGKERDATFIADACTRVPALVNHISALLARVDELEP